MNLSIHSLEASYLEGSLTPVSLVETLLNKIGASSNKAVWIVPPSRDRVLAAAVDLGGRDPRGLPLYGIPFVVKDNIDVAGIPTTAGCPDYAYTPKKNAPVVQHLLDAGAIFLGKTNLDQFATGLVGVRSPYGVPRNPFNADYLPGGSSSGSAVALAEGFCTFSLGTDTAGSGRVPASFNNLVGLKPSKGLISTDGVVPACRSLDCVSIFTLSCRDAQTVLDVAAQFDHEDPFSRPRQDVLPRKTTLRLGVPRHADLNFFGNPGAEALFEKALDHYRKSGAELVPIDFQPFMEAARLLYEGPWVTERYVAIEEFLKVSAASVHPVTRTIIEGGANPSAADLFKAQYRLMALRRQTDPVWESVDAIIAPTAGTNFTLEEVGAEPVKRNSDLGAYTNFMNLLDFSAVAVPAGFLPENLPWGVTLFAPAFQDGNLLGYADQLHQATGLGMGLTEYRPAAVSPEQPADTIQVVVCGAHLEGLALNHQIVGRGAVLDEVTQTASTYRFYAMPAEGSIPPRPALIYEGEGGAAIGVEVWSLSKQAFGDFVSKIPAPLGIGKVTLSDGRQLPGFIAEPRAQRNAEDITALGGWRAYLQKTQDDQGIGKVLQE